ncbi:protein of unknown function [Nitrospira japonica]|uniref:Uncharacterized protein n=1 Tax=Nitrospira japonica TaxID=1325564 RepID=A0A1W1I6Q4_9BACT|nr:protein of unknown function [Nitrospira japonica]
MEIGDRLLFMEICVNLLIRKAVPLPSCPARDEQKPADWLQRALVYKPGRGPNISLTPRPEPAETGSLPVRLLMPPHSINS